jgi:uncharacterized protein
MSAAPGASAEPPPGPAGEAAEAAARAPEPRPAEALDLGEASREAVLKRAAPVVVALAALIIVLRLIGRRR